MDITPAWYMRFPVLSDDRNLLIKILREKYNILTLVAGEKVLRILPPLIIGKKEVDIFCNKLERALNSITL